MSIVKDKYRGTTTYFHVMGELVRAAQYRGVTTYQDVAAIMGLPQSGNYMGSEVGQILGELVEDEVKANRPMLSVVVVDTRGRIGSGFFPLARSLGRFSGGEADEEAFVRTEREATYEAWRRPLPQK